MYYNSDDSSDDDYAPVGAASAMAAKHRLAFNFDLLRRHLQDESNSKILSRATCETVQLWRLRRIFGTWMLSSFSRSTWLRPLRAFISRQQSSLIDACVAYWRANTEADPRVFVDEWPDDDEFVSLISFSRLFFMKHRDDDRTSDVQVRMESGSRLQLPSPVFRQLEGRSALIADYNERVQVSLSLTRSSAPSSSISRLRKLCEKSVARRKNSSSRSKSPSSSSLVSSKDDDNSDFVDEASKSHLTSILEEGFGSAAVSPARAVAPSPIDLIEPSPEPSLDGSNPTDGGRSQAELASILEGGIGRSASPARTATSRLHEASQELDQQLRALREDEERSQRDHVPHRPFV